MRVFLIFSILISVINTSAFSLNSRITNDNLMINNESEEETNTLIELYSLNAFSGSASQLTLDTCSTGHFTYPGSKLYYSFTSTERQYIKLNYVGQNANLTMYNYNYYSANDYLIYFDNINECEDIIYMDMNQTYIFVLSNHSSWGDISITPSKLNTSFNEHEKYLLNITYDSNSSIGYHYEVKYYDISLTTATSTNGNIVMNFNSTQYLDLINENVNFKYDSSIENRRLISEPGFSYYSSIAYASSYVSFLNSNSTINYGGRSSGTFIDETTVLSCAHTIYKDRYEKNDDGIDEKKNTSLSKSIKIYPGANSYPNISNSTINFGKYEAYKTFVPISYVLYDGYVPYDWSISLTNNTTAGLYTHSYMGLSNFTFTGTEDNPASTLIQSAGYPGVTKKKDEVTGIDIDPNNYNYTMWTSYPQNNSVYGQDNTIYSKDIISSGGNSGCPWFKMSANTVNGVDYYYIGIVGVHRGSKAINDGRRAEAARMRPSIINLCKEIMENEK